jgi:hyperosmotically inducible protein
VKLLFGWKILASSTVLSFAMAVPVLAQSDNGATASESMHAAGESVEQAGSATGDAAFYAYRGAATAMRDTKITAKVKTALHEDNATSHSDIHVTTSAGIVTLRGEVGSTDAVTRAERLAHRTEGVREVDNRLKISRNAMAD